jgi:hypothetical protein
MVFLFVSIAVSIAQVSPTPPKTQEANPQGYPVMLGDQVLFHVQGVKAFRGDERAASISGRIKRLAEDYALSIDSIMVVNSEISTDILATDRVILSVFDSDAQAEKVPREELAERYVQKIRASIEKYREDYSRQALLLGLVYAFIATLALIAFFYLFNKLYQKGNRLTQTWISSRKISLHIQSFEIIRAERVGMILITGMKLARFFVFLIILYTYIHLGLSFFPWTRTFASQLFDYVLVPLQITGKAIGSQIPNVIFLAIIALITVYVLKLMRLFFNEIENGTLTFKGFYPEWAQPSYRISRLMVIAFAAVVAFPYIPGSESPAFKGISIFLGVLFSLGSTSFIANILAGYALTYRRVFKIGDRVKISDII